MEITVEQVYKDYYQKILWFIFNKVNDQTLAEDIASDVFLKITEHIDRFDPEKASIATWVYTITNRTLTDYYRKRRVFSVLPSEDGEEGKYPDILTDDEGLDKDLLIEEQMDSLVSALAKLPERERDLIILHYYNGLQLKEIAVKMGMSYANAKVVHKKALNLLKMSMA